MSMTAQTVSNAVITTKAENYVDKWYEGYNTDNFEWEVISDNTSKRAYMYQVYDDEIIGTIAIIEYDNYGNMISGSFWFDAVLNNDQVENIMNKQNTLEIANNILNTQLSSSVSDFDEISIVSNTHDGHNYWRIKYLNTSDYVTGYTIEIEKVSGELGNIGVIK